MYFAFSHVVFEIQEQRGKHAVPDAVVSDSWIFNSATSLLIEKYITCFFFSKQFPCLIKISYLDP